MSRSNKSFTGRVTQGLIAFLPLFLTVTILFFIFDFFSNLTRPFVAFVIDKITKGDVQDKLEGYQSFFVYPVSLGLSLVLLYLLGYFAQFGLKALMDKVLSRVPFVDSIYASIKQMVDLLGSSEGARNSFFKRVVLVEQSPGLQVLGFLTTAVTDRTGLVKACVYVPMPPNPTSGIIIWVDPKKVVKVDWSVEVAMKSLVSGGLLIPTDSQTAPLETKDISDLLEKTQ